MERVGEDLGQFAIGQRDGVAFHAAGAFGFFDNGGEIGLGDAEILQAGHTHLGGHVVDPVQGILQRGVGAAGDEGGHLAVFCEGGTFGGARLQGLDVGGENRRQQGGADESVGRLEHATDGAGKTVDGAQSGVGECEAAKQAAEGHVGPGFEVGAVEVGAVQGARDFSEAFAAEAVGQRIGLAGDEGFQQLDQRVQPRAGGYGRWHRDG